MWFRSGSHSSVFSRTINSRSSICWSCKSVHRTWSDTVINFVVIDLSIFVLLLCFQNFFDFIFNYLFVFFGGFVLSRSRCFCCSQNVFVLGRYCTFRLTCFCICFFR
uniref:Uncharacterized protein n=1 Tax=Cacopsylla melanoneura TaxID=428564 RepID=A0A8D8RXK4_9HEMI